MSIQQKSVLSKEKKVIPPKIQGWPLIGTVPHFYRQQLDFLLEARATHGDLFRLQLGETEITVLAHPRHAQHVLIDMKHVDFIGRMETMDSSMKELAELVGWNYEPLDKKNQSSPRDMELTEDQNERIRLLYARDLELFYPND